MDGSESSIGAASAGAHGLHIQSSFPPQQFATHRFNSPMEPERAREHAGFGSSRHELGAAMNAAVATTTAYRYPPRQQSRDPFVAEVLAAVADEYGLSEKEMMAPSRGHDVWKPRMAAMYYARLLTGCSLPELGRVFGGRSHTTVLRAFRRCRELIESDAQWAERLDRLLVRLVEKIIVPRSRDA